LELFISNLCSVHFPFVAIIFTSLAYEIFYARKVDLFDKIKEVVFSQHFPCVDELEKKPMASQFFQLEYQKSDALVGRV
jgi:hypothetical protein